MFATFAHCFTETMEYYGARPKPIRLDLPRNDPLAEALQEGHGAVVVTGHVGNWDIAAKTLCDYGRPINIVMAREVNATTHDFVRGARERAGVRVIYSDTSVFSSLNMIRALQRNEIIAIQLDRALGAGGTRLVPFFGAPAPFPSGPFVLARLAGAPLIPVFIPRLGTRHYAVRVCGRFAVSREARDARALSVLMGEVVRTFEDVVREYRRSGSSCALLAAGGRAAAAPLKKSQRHRQSACASAAEAPRAEVRRHRRGRRAGGQQCRRLSGPSRGARRVVRERTFPRYHIGESLLSATLPIPRRSGVMPAIERAGFVRKPGGLGLGQHAEPWSFFLSRGSRRLSARLSCAALGVRSHSTQTCGGFGR